MQTSYTTHHIISIPHHSTQQQHAHNRSVDVALFPFCLLHFFVVFFPSLPPRIWCVAFNTSTETMYSSGCVHVRVYHPDPENFNIFKWILVGRIRIIIIFFSFI